MKKLYFLFLLAFLAIQVKAQVDVPPLIITEWRASFPQYIEFTNVGDEPIQLGDFTFFNVTTHHRLLNLDVDSGFIAFDTPPELQTRLDSIILPAGKSYVIMAVFDQFQESGLPVHNIAMLDVADKYIHPYERSVFEWMGMPELEAYSFDSITPNVHGSNFGDYHSAMVLRYTYLNDSLEVEHQFVDQVNLSRDPNHFLSGDLFNFQGRNNTPVAGMTDVLKDHVFVRKSSITKGNMKWGLARGTDLETSEWMPVPRLKSKTDVFTSIGVHGNFSIDVTSKSTDVVIDLTDSTLTVPWQTIRGDSLIHQFTIGDGMSWSFIENPSDAADSVYYNVQNGDIFTLYGLGDELQILALDIIVTPATNDIAVVFPKRKQMYSEELDVIVWPQDYVYDVTMGLDNDSILDVSFATPTDTLLTYLEKPALATWEFVFVDEQERVELKHGDILKVTSENGSVIKEYVISVDEYEANNNAYLSLISWPDIDTDTYWKWTRNDTLPDFDPEKLSYVLELEGATNVPALQFKAEDPNSSIEVLRATDLNGTVDQRTTVVNVMSEDSIIKLTYKILFDLKETPIQPNPAEPFFSELMIGYQFSGMGVEICNPGNQDLDLSNYMIVKSNSTATLKSAVSAVYGNPNKDSKMNQIYRSHYSPGFRWLNDEDRAAWRANSGFLTPDNIVNTIVKPGDVFLLGSQNANGWPGGTTPEKFSPKFKDDFDICFYGFEEQGGEVLNPWGFNLHKNSTVAKLNLNSGTVSSSLWLLKILNDSIREGTKDVRDPNDYMVVDRIQKSLEVDSFWIAGRACHIPKNQGWNIIRKPHVSEGGTEMADGFGADHGRSAEGSDFIVHYREDADRINPEGPDELYGYYRMMETIGTHVMDPMTSHLSTITSIKMVVSDGYTGAQTITGDLTDLTVTTISQLLDKAHPDQVLLFKSGSDTLTSDDAVAADMILKVTSGNKKYSTSYTLVNAPLDADNLLVAVEGSELTVSEGTISGVALDSTISSLLGKLTVPALAVMNVIDDNNELVSLKAINFDSLVVDMTVGPNVMLEVIAQNGDIAIYSLDFGIAASEAVLLSNVFTIDQASRFVADVPVDITVDAMFEFVYPNENATIKVIDKAGFDRTSGKLNSDDQVVVTSEDESLSVGYFLNFIGETEQDANQKPEATATGAEEAITEIAEGFTATATDDGPVSSLTYSWEITSGDASTVTISSADQLETDVTFNDAGTFELSFTVSDGALSTIIINTINVSEPTGIDLAEMSAITIYPVPASDFVFIDFGNLNDTEARVKIIDMGGKVAYDNLHSGNNVEISLNNIKNGIYIISIKIDNQVSTRKLSIMK